MLLELIISINEANLFIFLTQVNRPITVQILVIHPPKILACGPRQRLSRKRFSSLPHLSSSQLSYLKKCIGSKLYLTHTIPLTIALKLGL